jgi:hypothetical protein
VFHKLHGSLHKIQHGIFNAPVLFTTRAVLEVAGKANIFEVTFKGLKWEQQRSEGVALDAKHLSFQTGSDIHAQVQRSLYPISPGEVHKVLRAFC